MSVGTDRRNLEPQAERREQNVLIRKPADIRPSEITSEASFINRREFIRNAGLGT